MRGMGMLGATSRRTRGTRATALGGLVIVGVSVIGAAADGPVPLGPAATGVPVTWTVPTPNPITHLAPPWTPSSPPVHEIKWPGPPGVVVNPAGRDPHAGGGRASDVAPVARSVGASAILAETAAPGGGTPGPAGSPTISLAVARSSGTYAQGEAVTFNVTVSNTTAASITVTKVEDVVPSGYLPAQSADLWMDGAACTATTAPTCTLDPTTHAVEVGSFTLAAGAQHALSLAMVANPAFLDCTTLQNTVTATDAAGTSSAWIDPSICDGGLGLTPWWSQWSQSTGPQATVSVLAANGNVIARQEDSTAIPLHGNLALDIRRTFNSLDTGDGEPTSPLGRGWIASFDRIGSGSTQDPYALSVPSSPSAGTAGGESSAAPYPVTTIDVTGNRQVFTLTALAAPIDVTALVGTSGPLSVLVPRVLQRDAGYGRICVDALAASPAGLHSNLWRYTEVPSTTGCSPAGGTPVVLGWGIETPDRARYEFNWSGAKIDVQDPFANEVRYQYSGSLAAGAAINALTQVSEPATGRALTLTAGNGQLSLVDNAGRSTTYGFDGSGNLASVVNPDPAGGSTLVYAYGGCSGLPTQLCSLTDPAGNASTLTYTATDSTGATMLGQPHAASFTDRRSQASVFSYVTAAALPTRMTATLANEQETFDQIDQTTGSIADHYRLDVAANTVREQTLLMWDTATAPCRQPDAVPDHNLCRTFRMTFDGASTAEDTSDVYNPLGRRVVERRCLSAVDSTTPAACPASTQANVTSADTTWGYHSQYLETSGTVNQFDDSTAGAGTVTSTGPTSGRADALTVSILGDLTQLLPPRGNIPGVATPMAYATTRLIDSLATVSANRPAAANICATPGAPAGNTGAVCEEDSPSFDSGRHSATVDLYKYAPDGAVTSHTTPDATAATYVSVVSPDAPWALYHLDDPAGTAPIDATGHSTSTALGGLTAGVASATKDRDTAMAFDGTTGGIKAHYTNTFVQPITSVSVEAWVNLQSNRSTAFGIQPVASSAINNSAAWELDVSDVATSADFKIAGDGGSFTTLTVSSLTLIGGWHHLAGTYDGATMNLYVDGVLKGSRTLRASGTQSNAFCMGALLKLCGQNPTGCNQPPCTPASGSFAKGSIDEVAVYTSVLSAGQIASHFSAGASPATPTSTTYTYYQDADRDLSGTTAAGGWLKGVTDAFGHFIALGYDAGGNPVRSWDRDATQGLALANFPGSITTPASPAYSETLYGPLSTNGPAVGSYRQAWRFPLSSRDPLNDLTTYAVDADGNRTGIRSARGNEPLASSPPCAPRLTYDTCMTFDHAGHMLTRQLPAESVSNHWVYTYDVYGNPSAVESPEGHWTTFAYDAANRHIGTHFTRGPWNSSVPPTCRESTTADAPIPSALILCSTAETFDGVGNSLSTTDANGNSTSFSYDALHRLLTQVVPRGDANYATVRTDRVYDLDGNVTSVCRPRAFATTSDGGSATTCMSSAAQPYRGDTTYDVAGRAVRQTTYRATTAYVTTNTYDADGNVVATQDPNGHQQKLAYDVLDRNTSAQRQRDTATWVTTSTAYDPAGHVITATAGAGHSTAYVYDAAGRRTDTVQGWDGIVSPVNAVTSSDGGSNVHTRVTYDADGNVVQSYDARAFSGGPTDQRTFMVTLIYDPDGRQTGQYTPRYDAGSYTDLSANSATQGTQCPTNTPGYPATVGVCVTQVVYDADNEVTQLALPTATNVSAARRITYAYTDDHLEASVTTPGPTGSNVATVSQGYLYDADGKVIQQTDQLGRTTNVGHTKDELVAEVDAPPNGSQTHITRYAYDADGDQLTVTPPAGNSTTKTYTTDDLTASSADGLNDTTRYTYDGARNVTQVYSPAASARVAPDPSGKPTTNTYTYDNLPLTTTVPVSGDGTSQLRKTSYGYTDYGAKASQDTALVTASGTVLGDGGAQRFTYYPDNRLDQETGRQGESIVHTYDAAGNQTGIASGATNIAATYYLDDLVRSVTDSTTVAGAGQATTQYGYDGGGSVASRLESLQTGGQYTTTYGYDDAGLTTSMAANWMNPGAWSWSYEADGLPTAMTDPSGNHTQYAWNADGTLLTRTLNVGGGTNVLVQWAYTYDQDYRQTSRQFHGADIKGATPGFATNYTYDGAGRLSTFQYNNFFTGAWAPTETAVWDADGNRTSWGDGTAGNTRTATYNADASMASSTVNGTTYTPSYGFTGTLANDGCVTHQYDGFDRMTSSQPTGGANCGHVDGATFVYDGLNRQLSVNDGPYGGGTAVHFDGLGTAVASEQQDWGSANSADVAYAMAPSGEVLGDTFAPAGFSRTELLSTDGYSAATIATSLNGALNCDSYTDPFGAPIFPQGSNPCQTGGMNDTVLYRQAQRDATTGIYQMGARSYDPAKASFVQPDSYRTGGSNVGLRVDPNTANAYVYAGGDPVNRADPTGHNPCSTEGYDDSGNQGCNFAENAQWAAGSAAGQTSGTGVPFAGTTNPPDMSPGSYHFGTKAPGDNTPPAATQSTQPLFASPAPPPLHILCVSRVSSDAPCSQVLADTPKAESYCGTYVSMQTGPQAGTCVDMGSISGTIDPDSRRFRYLAACIQAVMAGEPCAYSEDMDVATLLLVGGTTLLGGALDIFDVADIGMAGDAARIGSGVRIGAAGTADMVRVREFYLAGERALAAHSDGLIASGASPYLRARILSAGRNALRTEARRLGDPELARFLDRVKPNMSWDQVVQKYASQGLQGDDLWNAISEAALRTNAEVNKALGVGQ
jgi:RHS repeat-associated protein/uncharacterized repeat protein (TIGR01451 family)